MEDCCRKKHRTEEEQKRLSNRLSRIEGQVRGLQRMLEEDCYCVGILTQVSATSAALNAFSRELLSEHLRTCVAEDIRAGQEEKLDELLKVLPKLMK